MYSLANKSRLIIKHNKSHVTTCKHNQDSLLLSSSDFKKRKICFFLKQYKVKALLLELIDFTINRQLAKVQNVIIN